MSTQYRFIFIDDNKDYHQTLISYARDQKVTLKTFECGIDGIEELKRNPDKYLGVILDFNCKYKKGDKPDVGTLSRILADLNALNKSLPRVVLSGEPDAISQKKYHPNIRFFNKNDGAKQCITSLKNQAKKYPTTIIKEQNGEVFSIFEKEYLDSSSERELIAILKNLEEYNYKPLREDLSSHRLLIASSFRAMLGQRPDLFGSNLATTDLNKPPEKLELGPYIDKLKSILLYDSIPGRSLKFVNQISSSEGHHNDRHTLQIGSPIKYGSEPSLYTLKAITNCLMDYLKWFQIWMDKNDNRNN